MESTQVKVPQEPAICESCGKETTDYTDNYIFGIRCNRSGCGVNDEPTYGSEGTGY